MTTPKNKSSSDDHPKKTKPSSDDHPKKQNRHRKETELSTIFSNRHPMTTLKKQTVIR